MIIAVTSPRAGVGRTTLSIVLAARLAQMVKGKVNLVDMNASQDLEYHLNKSAPICRSLDDFAAAYSSKLIDTPSNPAHNDAFLRKSVTTAGDSTNMFITSSHNQYEITDEIIGKFVEFSQNNFQSTIIDCKPGWDTESAGVFDVADFVVVVLNQDERQFHMIKHQYAMFYRKYNKKMIFVMDKYIGNMGNVQFQLKDREARNKLLESGLSGRVFVVPFSPRLINDVNQKLILQFISRGNDPAYIKFVDELNKYMLGVE